MFSLVSQEQRQRNVSSQTCERGTNSLNGMASQFEMGLPSTITMILNHFATIKAIKKLDRIVFQGHTIDCGYKLHRYLPGYKPKPRFSKEPSNTTVTVNQLSTQDQSYYKTNQVCDQTGQFLKTLDNNQYQHLVIMLSIHLMTSVSTHSSSEAPAIPHTSGSYFSIYLNRTSNPIYDWIIVSGASKHVCSNANMFLSLNHISNSVMTLPNNIRNQCLYGDIKISP